MIITIKSKNVFGVMCSSKEMYNWLQRHELFWKGYFAYYFGKETYENAKEDNKKNKMSWKERTKKKFLALKNNKFGEISYKGVVIPNHITFPFKQDLNIIRDYKYVYCYHQNSIWKITKNNVDQKNYLNIFLENIENNQITSKISYPSINDCDIYGVPTNYKIFSVYNLFFERSSVVNSIKEREDIEMIEVSLQNFNLRISFSLLAFNLLKFFRSRKNRTVLLSYVDCKHFVKVLNWNYK